MDNITDIELLLPQGHNMQIVERSVTNDFIKFYINLKGKEEFKDWLMQYANNTGTSYSITQTHKDDEDGPKIIFKQRLHCRHATKHSNVYESSRKRPKTRNTNCPSKMTVTIYFPRKKYRGQEVAKHNVINNMPCEIILFYKHNHSTGTAESLRFRAVSEATKLELIDYFQKGHSACSALEMLKVNIQLHDQDYVKTLADRSRCPDYSYCHRLFTKEFNPKYGPINMDKTFLEEKISEYNKHKNETCAKVVFKEDDEYVIGICTPIMKRVHSHIEGASQMVLMDSSGSMDRNGSRVFVMLTHSECGALPLGIFITSSESADAIITGFNIIKDILGQSIFGGSVGGPKVFLTDDSVSEQTAVRSVWPETKHFLCIFHVLQAVLRWLSKSTNGIPIDKQSESFKDFHQLLYSKSLKEIEENYEMVIENAKSFPNFINYLNGCWWEKRDQWIIAYRNSWIIKNNHTNDYSESMIRQLKDKIFSRVKAFNLAQTVDFMLNSYEDYNERKLLDAASNCLKSDLFNKDIKLPPPEIFYRIKQLAEFIIAVPSKSKSDLIYIVNTKYLTCSCYVGITGSICKHMDWANMLFYQEDCSTIDNKQTRKMFSFIATGKMEFESWFTLIHSGNDLSNDSKPHVYQELTDSDPCSSNTIHSSAVTEMEINESKKDTFNDIWAKITQKVETVYSKSPSETIAAAQKMLENISRIKTPSDFTSALATFGIKYAEGSRQRGRKIPLQSTSASRRKQVIRRTNRTPSSIGPQLQKKIF